MAATGAGRSVAWRIRHRRTAAGSAAEPYWVHPSISTRPYALEPEEGVPHVKVEFDEDVWTPPMDPAAFAVFIDRLAGHVEHLRNLHAQLVTAVAAPQGGEQ